MHNAFRSHDRTTMAAMPERSTRRRGASRLLGLDWLAALAAAAGCALAGCAMEAGPTPAPTATSPEPVGTTRQALTSTGGGGGGSFSCGPLGCICTSDWDCNNLFGSGACGTWPAKCYTRGPSQYCICAPWVGSAVGATGDAPTVSGGVVATRATSSA